MRNAAMTFGLIGGILGMIVGFFVYGYATFIDSYGEIPDLARQVETPGLFRAIAVVLPLLAIAGGAMARSRALWAGVMMLMSAAKMYYAFGFGVFTMFPIVFCGLCGVLPITVGKQDEEKTHS